MMENAAYKFENYKSPGLWKNRKNVKKNLESLEGDEAFEGKEPKCISQSKQFTQSKLGECGKVYKVEWMKKDGRSFPPSMIPYEVLK